MKTYGMTVQEQDLVWEEWRAGVSMSKIGSRLGRPYRHVLRYMQSSGGIRPKPRTEPRHHLSLEQREEISRGLVAGDSFRAIAARLGRSHTTISREVNRHGGRQQYRAAAAHAQAQRNRARPKAAKLATNRRLRDQVLAWLEDDWSPEQISHRLPLQYPDDPAMRVSPECIYLAIFCRHRKVFNRDIHVHLRSRRTMRHPKRPKSKTGSGRLRNMVPIQQRPAEAEGRQALGHLEGDLVMGKRPSAVATLVDRMTRQVRIVAVPGLKSDPVTSALTANLNQLPAHARRTLTWDRGREMAEHRTLTEQTGCQVYFCDPQSPWQRGSNENMNRLIRAYLPRSTDLTTVSQTRLDQIADKLNRRPRKTLGWRTPDEVYAEAIGALTP